MKLNAMIYMAQGSTQRGVSHHGTALPAEAGDPRGSGVSTRAPGAATADARGKLRIREGAFVCLDWAGKVRH